MSNEELAAKAARMADRVMAARLYAATPDCKASRASIEQSAREQWGPREWAALEQFMAKCWDGRMGQRVD